MVRYRDSTVLPLLSRAILATLSLPRNHSDDMTEYRRKVLFCQCRELEKFLKLRKSVAAQREADKLKIGDLSKFKWADQQKKSGMGDRGRKTFHFEHTVPVAMLVEKLDAIKKPTLKAVESVIAIAEVSWITKQEDKELARLKLRHKRSNPVEAYALAKIVLCPE